MKFPERLVWTFAVLVLLFGVPLIFLDKDGPHQALGHALAGGAAVSLGAFGASLAWHAWSTGEIRLQHFHYRRAAQPVRFAVALAVILTAGVGTMVAGLWLAFLKFP